MVVKITSAAVVGLDAYRVDVEFDTTNSLPGVVIIGLPDASINEAKERLRLAIKNSGFSFPQTKAVINLAPADLKKEGTGFDLAMAAAILVKQGDISNVPDDTAFVGELSLDGGLRPISGILPIASALKDLGLKKVILPQENIKEAGFVDGIKILGARNLKEVVEYINSGVPLESANKGVEDFLGSMSPPEDFEVDFKYIKGQLLAKKALEIAAAGGHNVLLSGSPGSGKTLLSKAFVSILPPLSKDEAIELTKIYSVSGLLDPENPVVTKRPFRSPHHSASAVGIIGGGSNPKPGEITLAHRGVLFLDEMVEFPRAVLEVLRQPLEDGEVTISRAQTSVKYPANFILIGAVNPCPCGFLGDNKRECTCSDFQIQRYRSRLSGPLLDRIDLQIEVPRLSDDELLGNTQTGEDSKAIRERVIKARKMQAERYKGGNIYTNSELSARQIGKYCKIDPQTQDMLKSAISRFKLSGRTYDRLLKIARTIADLEGKKDIAQEHIAQALQFRGQSL